MCIRCLCMYECMYACMLRKREIERERERKAVYLKYMDIDMNAKFPCIHGYVKQVVREFVTPCDYTKVFCFIQQHGVICSSISMYIVVINGMTKGEPSFFYYSCFNKLQMTLSFVIVVTMTVIITTAAATATAT